MIWNPETISFTQEVGTYFESGDDHASPDYTSPDVHISKDGTSWDIVTASYCGRFSKQNMLQIPEGETSHTKRVIPDENIQI